MKTTSRLAQVSCVGARGFAPYKPLIKQGLWAHSRAPLQALIKIEWGFEIVSRPAALPTARLHESTKARERVALLLVQLEADGVDAVALTGRLRSIGENVTEVSVTFAAQDFGSARVKTVIYFRTHTLV